MNQMKRMTTQSLGPKSSGIQQAATMRSQDTPLCLLLPRNQPCKMAKTPYRSSQPHGSNPRYQTNLSEAKKESYKNDTIHQSLSHLDKNNPNPLSQLNQPITIDKKTPRLNMAFGELQKTNNNKHIISVIEASF